MGASLPVGLYQLEEGAGGLVSRILGHEAAFEAHFQDGLPCLLGANQLVADTRLEVFDHGDAPLNLVHDAALFVQRRERHHGALDYGQIQIWLNPARGL